MCSGAKTTSSTTVTTRRTPAVCLSVTPSGQTRDQLLLVAINTSPGAARHPALTRSVGGSGLRAAAGLTGGPNTSTNQEIHLHLLPL